MSLTRPEIPPHYPGDALDQALASRDLPAEEFGEAFEPAAGGPTGGDVSAATHHTAEEARIRRHTQWGKTIAVPRSPNRYTQNIPWSTAVYTPVREEAVDWTIDVQANKIGDNQYLEVITSAPPNGYLWMQITYTLGEATFIRGPFLIATTGVQRFHVVGRRVQVDFANTDVPNPQPTDTLIQVTAGVAEGGVADSPLDFHLGRWQQAYLGSGTNPASQALAPAGNPGVIMAYQAVCTTMSGDAQLYLVYTDFPPVPGKVTIWNSPPFTAANQWYAFGEDADEKIFFTGILFAAMSSTPDVYTAPTGSPAVFVRTKIGT